MGAERDPDGFVPAHANGNPEVIDIAWNPVDFRGESDRHTSDVDKFSMAQVKVPMLAVLAVSMWQSEIEYDAPWSAVERRESESCPTPSRHARHRYSTCVECAVAFVKVGRLA